MVLTESFSRLWAQLVVPVIDRKVRRYAIEHWGSLRTLLKLPPWQNLPSNVVRHVASLFNKQAWPRWRIPSGTLVTAVYIRPFEPSELPPTEPYHIKTLLRP